MATKSLLKIMKNIFLFHFKSTFRSEGIELFVLPFGHAEKRLDEKGYFKNSWHRNLGNKQFQTHALPNILTSKGNQTMKFGQLIEYNMRNVFLEKSHTKCGGKTISITFSKKSKLSISRILFLLFVKLRVLEVYWN